MDILHEVKFKILAFLSAVLVLLSFLVSPIHFSASKVLAEEYLSPLEELQASEGFDEISLSTKTDITVIDFMEYWDDKAELPLYFVYVYNPTDKVLKDSTDNRIHIQTNNSGHWNSYKLSYVKATEDGKYVKYVVSEPELLYNTHTDNTKRYYDVSEVKLMCDNNTTPSTFTVGFRYLFVFGNSGLEVTKEEYDVIRVDTIIPMVYRNIEENVYDYPKGQINSVAFALPNDVLEQYGEVSKIHFEYWRYRTSPIVVSDTRNGYNLHERRAEWVGKKVAKSDNSNLLKITWGKSYPQNSNNIVQYPDMFDYTYNHYLTPLLDSKTKIKAYDKLTYSFCAGDMRAVDYDVSSEDLADWVYSYADTYLLGQEYDSIPVKDGKLPAELFEDPHNEKYGYKDVYVKAETLEYKEQVSPNWWEQFLRTNTSYNDPFDTIQKVSYGDYNSLSKSVYCDFYKINETYYEKLGTLSQSAGRTDKTAYIFHFDISDYYTSPAFFSGDIGYSGGYVAQTDVFLNFTFIDFTFCKNGVATVLAVSSDVIDIFPPIQHPIIPEPFDWWALLVKIIAIIVGIIVLVVVLRIVISLFKLIFGGKDKPKKKNSKKSNRRRKK